MPAGTGFWRDRNFAPGARRERDADDIREHAIAQTRSRGQRTYLYACALLPPMIRRMIHEGAMQVSCRPEPGQALHAAPHL